MFETRLSKEAIKSYDVADNKTVQRLNKVIENISKNPFFGPHIRKLKGKLRGSYRYKLGSIRIVYSVEQKDKIVWIEYIRTREKSYR